MTGRVDQEQRAVAEEILRVGKGSQSCPCGRVAGRGQFVQRKRPLVLAPYATVEDAGRLVALVGTAVRWSIWSADDFD